jgi:hypothetical protein
MSAELPNREMLFDAKRDPGFRVIALTRPARRY